MKKKTQAIAIESLEVQYYRRMVKRRSIKRISSERVIILSVTKRSSLTGHPQKHAHINNYKQSITNINITCSMLHGCLYLRVYYIILKLKSFTSSSCLFQHQAQGIFRHIYILFCHSSLLPKVSLLSPPAFPCLRRSASLPLFWWVPINYCLGHLCESNLCT